MKKRHEIGSGCHGLYLTPSIRHKSKCNMSIQFIYFDLDDTLTDHKISARHTLVDLYEKYVKATPNAPDADRFVSEYEQVNRAKWIAYSKNEIEKEEVKYGRFRDTMMQLGVNGWPVDKMSEEFLSISQKYWHWIEGAEKAFEAIRQEYPCGIITNGFSEIQEIKFEHFGMAELADPLLISEEVGTMKPNKELFEYAANLVGHPSHELLYVGDSITSDVAGGLGAGWKVAWYNPDGQILPDQFKNDKSLKSFSSFTELPKLIEGWRDSI